MSLNSSLTERDRFEVGREEGGEEVFWPAEEVPYIMRNDVFLYINLPKAIYFVVHTISHQYTCFRTTIAPAKF